VKKGILFAICLALLVFLQAIAMAAPTQKQDAKQLINQYTEVQQKVEAGINYRAFSVLRRGLSTATQQFREKYPKEDITEHFVYLSQLYADLEEIWQLRVEKGVQFLPKNREQGQERGTSKYFMNTIMLKMQYPEVLNASLESKDNGYFVNSVLDNLIGYAGRIIKVVNEKL
jgi:hypothetical protein